MSSVVEHKDILTHAKRGVSPTALMFRRLRRNRVALIGFALLVVLYLGAIFADLLSPYHPLNQDLMNTYHPPTTLHFIDNEGKFHLRPFVYRYDLIDLDGMTYERDTSTRYPLRFFSKGYEYKLFWLIPTRVHIVTVAEPARLYLFGSDGLGRDIFSRLLHGSRISLSIGLIGICISFTIAMIVGGVSGYFGGLIDDGIMRIIELIQSIPGLYLIFALRTSFPQDISSTAAYRLMVIILGLIFWGSIARVIRSMTLSLREQEYVMSARALGASSLRIIVRHILPNTFSYLIVAATISIPGYILGEVALSYLGVGIQEPYASWGNMLHQAQNIEDLTRFPWLLAPGFLIFITVFAFNFFGDGLRDAFDPRHVEGS